LVSFPPVMRTSRRHRQHRNRHNSFAQTAPLEVKRPLSARDTFPFKNAMRVTERRYIPFDRISTPVPNRFGGNLPQIDPPPETHFTNAPSMSYFSSEQNRRLLSIMTTIENKVREEEGQAKLKTSKKGGAQSNHFQQTLAEIGKTIQARNAALDQFVGTFLQDDKVVSESLGKGKFCFFGFAVEPETGVKLDFEINSGKVEVFVSGTDMYSFAKSPSCLWNAVIPAGSRSQNLPPIPDANYTGYLYISVVGRAAHNAISLKASTKTTRAKISSIQGQCNIRAQVKAKVDQLRGDPDFRARVRSAARQTTSAEDLQQIMDSDLIYRHMQSIPQWRPIARQRNKVSWQQRHQAVLEANYNRKTEILKENAKAVLAEAEYREKRQLEYVERVERERRAKALYSLHSNWFWIIKAGTVFSHWTKEAEKLMEIKRTRRKYQKAAITIQCFYRRFINARRTANAKGHMQALRSAVLLFAHNYSAVKPHRAADIIAHFFLKQPSKFQVGVKMFHSNICKIQRRVKANQRCNRAKVFGFCIAWLKCLAANKMPDKVPDSVKAKLCQQHYFVLRNKVSEMMIKFEMDLVRWFSCGCPELGKPQIPRVRITIPQSELFALIKAGEEYTELRSVSLDFVPEDKVRQNCQESGEEPPSAKDFLLQRIKQGETAVYKRELWQNTNPREVEPVFKRE